MTQEPSSTDRWRAAKDTFRALLVHVQPDEAAHPRLSAAAALARRLEATLLGVGAESLQQAIVSDVDGAAPLWIVELQRQIEADLKAAEEAFRRETAGLDARWTQGVTRPAHSLAELARSADLIVAGGSPLRDHDPRRWADPAELVLLSGRPVLVAPPGGGELRAEGVVVAWKDTREARRAVHDALPFLCAAQDVVVTEICDRDDFAGAQYRTGSVVEGLKRHGAPARAKVVTAAPEGVAGELAATAESVGADLIVAGGYGHSRFGEWFFGGVTRDLLRQAERFTLLSH